MDLESSFNSLSVENYPPIFNNCAILIEGVHTEIIQTHFSNYINLIVTQFGKIGNLYQVKVDQPANGFSISEAIYTINTLLGGDNFEAEVAARYLTEKLKISQPLLLSLSLKNFSKGTLDLIIEAIQSHTKL
ncbi:hypothetical protein NQ317_013578 [Molorchus minor]|uniref:Proteasome assembly chaperone 3 n=1 Tax=Molorchus minor TaxID=1323400 RepID=A0ABQ9IQP8_9CUCU|nr:hypothetical protein NQ317_013578 [Molorchus minor]